MTFTPLLREGKNMSTLTTFLDRFEKNIQEICELNEIRKQLEARHRAFQSAIYTAFNSPPKTSESAEDYVRRMAADKTALEGRRRELVAITTAIDEIPLPRPEDESYEQYILRLGDYIRAVSSALNELGPCDGETIADSIHRMRRERNNAERKMAELEDSHARTIEQANARIAKLETRESELNALHDAIESLPGFPMQPQESYAAYLQRLAADRAQLAEAAQNTCSNGELAEALRERDMARTELASEREQLNTNKMLQLNLVHQRDGALDATKSAQSERDNFRARWEESLAERDRAVDEARRTSEANQAMQGDVTLRSQILARIMIDPSTDKLFNDRDWNAAARKVLIEARGMVGDTATDRARERYASEVKEMLRPYAE